MFHRSKYFIHPLLYCETFFFSAPLVCLVTSIHILISVERQPRSQQSIFVATARTDGESDKKSEVETVRRRLRHRLHRASEVTELCSLYYFIRRFPLSISTMFFFIPSSLYHRMACVFLSRVYVRVLAIRRIFATLNVDNQDLLFPE